MVLGTTCVLLLGVQVQHASSLSNLISAFSGETNGQKPSASVERVGHPDPGPAQLRLASFAPRLCWNPSARPPCSAEAPPLVDVPPGRLHGNIRPRPPVLHEQVTGAQAGGVLGAVPAGAPWWPRQHHRLLPRGQQALASTPLHSL